MFGIRFIKAQPTTYLLQYRGGKVVREGTGTSFFYYAPMSSLIAVPVGSRAEDFIFEPITADFQAVTVQGQVTWRIGEPKKAAGLLDFSLNPDGRSYASDDPDKLPARLVGAIEVLTRKAVSALPLTDALTASDAVARAVAAGLTEQAEIRALGLQVLGLAILAIKPTPETARALEAEARESILKAADEAIFERRNAAVENERAIRESELDTEIAVELKKRAIRETQMEAEASIRARKAQLRDADMQADIALEEKRKQYVTRNAENARTLAEAEAYRVGAVMAALEKSDPRVVQALAAAGMQPGQLIAQAFGGLAERAEKIGQLNISPELLQTLLRPSETAGAGRGPA
jgi:hypothetical protein